MEHPMNRIFQAFEGLAWPEGTDMPEDKFNKEKLHTVLKSVDCLCDIEIVDEMSMRREEAIPFFGWAACGASLNRIDGHSQSDCLFRKNSLNILIENKIIREGKNEECNIKNAMVQAIEYLNLYNVSGAILLIFDDGRAKERNWDNFQEQRLVNCLISEYPFCVVRIRRNEKTLVYYQ